MATPTGITPTPSSRARTADRIRWGCNMVTPPSRDTWQLKMGPVLNPLGAGIFKRPTLRLLYGLQYSTANAAWSNSFVNSLAQNNIFQSVETHWHQVIALEAEAWF